MLSIKEDWENNGRIANGALLDFQQESSSCFEFTKIAIFQSLFIFYRIFIMKMTLCDIVC